jgi:hypothetical protein
MGMTVGRWSTERFEEVIVMAKVIGFLLALGGFGMPTPDAVRADDKPKVVVTQAAAPVAVAAGQMIEIQIGSQPRTPAKDFKVTVDTKVVDAKAEQIKNVDEKGQPRTGILHAVSLKLDQKGKHVIQVEYTRGEKKETKEYVVEVK